MYDLNKQIGLEGIKKSYSNASGGCSAPTDTRIKDLNSQLSALDKKISVYTNKYNLAKAKIGAVGACGLGRSVDVWWSRHTDLKLPSEYGTIVLGKTWYCEPNFIQDVANWYSNALNSLKSTRTTLQKSLQEAQASFDASMTAYKECIAEEAKATATVQSTDPTVIAAQTEAESEEAKLEMKMQQQKTQNTIIIVVIIVVFLLLLMFGLVMYNQNK